MTTPTFTCDELSARLADFLEGEIDQSTRASIEAHAESCADCGALLADLRRLRADAARLPLLAPSRDLWSGVADRIETPVVELGATRPAAKSGRTGMQVRRMVVLRLGAAAAALVIATALVTHHLTARSVRVASTGPGATPAGSVSGAPVAPAPAAGGASAPTTTPVANRTSVETSYDAEIARLRAIVAQRRSVLDSATIAVIDQNLQVIDEAIAQCRAALRKDPGSGFLIESLDDALSTKVRLLRTAAALPSRA